MNHLRFEPIFHALTGHPPFPWQIALHERFINDDIPASASLPTGLGKTSIIAVWLIALANGANVPRRLVYVVNRRTVVDQTTDEVVKYQAPLAHRRAPFHPLLLDLADALARLSSDGGSSPLALSTLRGQFADNREWSADPSRPAVICGTVDMIGSRLLFSGYGVGFKGKPLHAGFLGQDAILVHDEAHLEPAFQKLIKSIEAEQTRERDVPWPKFRVMELTATSRGTGEVFELTDVEKAIPNELPEEPSEPKHFVWQRMKSKKGLKFQPAKRNSVATTIGEMARDQWKDSGKAILIFVRTIDDVKEVTAVLTDKKKGGVAPEQVKQLTGTMRGLERDALATTDDVFARFMPSPKVKGKDGTAYLICTSAGEVGVDISADHMVCDLSTLDSMAQRFGRVNRRGEGEAQIDLVYETDPNPKPPSPEFEAARWETKKVLERLPPCDWIDRPHDASPVALGVVIKTITDDERIAAFAPPPTILPVTDILFDAWALTSIRKLPGRPPVAPYLHGISTWEPPETHVAWRAEVEELTPKEFESVKAKSAFQKYAAELLEDYPLKPHELLRDNSNRVFDRLKKLKADHNTPIWILSDDDSVEATTFGELLVAGKDDLGDKRILLPPTAGGLSNGLLSGDSSTANDVADEWYADKERTKRRRVRVWDEADEKATGMRLIRRIDFEPTGEDEDAEGRSWYWYELPAGGDSDGSKSNRLPVTWAVHTADVVGHAGRIVDAIPLPDEIKQAVKLAAEWHDLGKRRKMFQSILGNFRYPDRMLAKSGKSGGRVVEQYRHEFGSLFDIEQEPEFLNLGNDLKDLVRHLIAVHHGRGRPHFSREESFDPHATADEAASIASEVPRRFARLQRKYGRWGLAYLESLLRAADYAASASPSEFEKGGPS